jgi:hypothetical protein
VWALEQLLRTQIKYVVLCAYFMQCPHAGGKRVCFNGRSYLRRLVCPAVSVAVFVGSAGRRGTFPCRTLCIGGLFY